MEQWHRGHLKVTGVQYPTLIVQALGEVVVANQ